MIYHISNLHYSLFPKYVVRLKAQTVSKKYSFTDSCKYVFNDEDQYDWNKLTGLSFNLLDARQDSIMCGWRYNPINDMFELCSYYHVNGSFNPPSTPLISVKSGEVFEVSFIFDKVNKEATIQIKTEESIVSNKTPFDKFGINRTINTWFGGTKPAPHSMQIKTY